MNSEENALMRKMPAILEASESHGSTDFLLNVTNSKKKITKYSSKLIVLVIWNLLVTRKVFFFLHLSNAKKFYSIYCVYPAC